MSQNLHLKPRIFQMQSLNHSMRNCLSDINISIAAIWCSLHRWIVLIEIHKNRFAEESRDFVLANIKIVLVHQWCAFGHFQSDFIHESRFQQHFGKNIDGCVMR